MNRSRRLDDIIGRALLISGVESNDSVPVSSYINILFSLDISILVTCYVLHFRTGKSQKKRADIKND